MPSPVGILIKRPAVSAAWNSSVPRTISFKRLDNRSLLMDRQLRVTDNICEQYMRDFELNFLCNLGSHVLFRRGRGGEFLEARIIPERIEHRIEPEQRRSQQHVYQRALVRYRQ